MTGCSRLLQDEAALADWAASMAGALPASLFVALEGNLGAGKTTLVRNALRALGHDGPVPSPTYTLIESYDLGARLIHHLDLYRLSDPEELEFIGFRDLLAEPAVFFVEWPGRAGTLLPDRDLMISLEVADAGRWLAVEAGSERGRRVCDALVAAAEPGSGAGPA